MVSVKRQEHILQAETGQHKAVFKVWKGWQVQSLCVVLQNRCQGDQESANQENKEEETSSDLDDDYIYLNETTQHQPRATNYKVWCKSTHCTNQNCRHRRFRRTRE